MMEDGSGGIEVKRWIESDDTDQQAQQRSEWGFVCFVFCFLFLVDERFR